MSTSTSSVSVRPKLGVLAAAVVAIAAGAVGYVLASEAQAADVRVLCTQVPAKVGQLDEQYIANYMSEQLDEGRNHFATVPGVSTVLCAW